MHFWDMIEQKLGRQLVCVSCTCQRYFNLIYNVLSSIHLNLCIHKCNLYIYKV